MKTSQINRILVSAFICAALAACTDSSIKEVKKSSMPQSEFTFGEILGNPKGCTDTEWAHHDEERGGVVVQYTCTTEISSTLIESARKDNSDRVKELTKHLEEDWQLALKGLEKRKKSMEESAVRASTNNESKQQEGRGQLRAAQERLNRELASSPQDYIGHGPSGYTPELIEMGKERMQLAIRRAKKEVEDVQRRMAALETGQNDSADASQQFRPLDHYKTPAEYQSMIDGMLSWKDRYYTALGESEAGEMKKAEEFLLAAKDRKLQLKIAFLVQKNSRVVPLWAKWTSDGKDDGGVNIYLTPLFQDPRRTQQVIETALRSRLSFDVDRMKRYRSFPIECGEKIPTGCELRKSAS